MKIRCNHQGMFVSVIIELFFVVIARSQILITESGIMPLRRGDTGITFWLTVLNLKYEAQNVSAEMCQCCEVLSNSEIECDHMKLVPSRTETLNGRDSLNLTLIYPTLYPHQRRGMCQVDVKSVLAAAPNYVLQSKRNCPLADDAATNEDSISPVVVSACVKPRHIKFDTRVSFTYLPPLLSNYYDISELQWRMNEDLNMVPNPTIDVCLSPDEDPLDKCSPVDCAIKYAGTRSFFDTQTRRCSKVPSCLSHQDGALPNMAYIPNSNTCRDMELTLDVEDVEFLKYGEHSKQKRSSIERQNSSLRCHNGMEDPKTDVCVCDEGWETYSIEEDKGNPPLPVLNNQEDLYHTPMHMCTVKTIKGGPYFRLAAQELTRTMALIPALVIITFILMVLIFMMCVICMWLVTGRCCRRHKKKYV